MAIEISQQVFNINESGFDRLAIDIFHFQYEKNPVYKSFTDALNIDPYVIDAVTKIPFLPIRFFKTHVIKTTTFEPEFIFESSGTTQTVNSRHYVKDLSVYERSFLYAFERFYGDPGEWCIIGLLPSYLERNNSSLIMMVDRLVKESHHPGSGFYLYEHDKLHKMLMQLETEGQKTLLIGVSFALLDFAEKYAMQLKHTVVMETGGMKGRRKELTRDELHKILKTRLGVDTIHSEYGMTELLSQAYSKSDGIFEPVPWMKILVRAEDDPFDVQQKGAGIINVIDLANIYSCSFIATDDVGKTFGDRKFEISGRVDNSDIRGCSLLIV
ncbi:MAG: acyl transferase [Bacteroidetes bacterium]|nr:acyl transferase [Bacteroidota bacterium]